MDYESPLTVLDGCGPARSDAMAEGRGVETLYDLVRFYPYRHIDRTKLCYVREITPETESKVTVAGEVRSARIRRSRSGQSRLHVQCLDARGTDFDVVFFQGAYQFRRIFDAGDRYAFYGKPSFYQGDFSMAQPEFAAIPSLDDLGSFSAVLPVYPGSSVMEDAGINDGMIQEWILSVLDELGAPGEMVPAWIRQEHDLLSSETALRQLHRPPTMEALAKAKRTIKFEEIFTVQRLVAEVKLAREGLPAPVLETPGEKTLVEALPFELTGAQKRCIREVTKDLESGFQMNRLLQGDVGSGKTVVAAAAAARALAGGYDVAFMAPTEILAQQHRKSLQEHLEPLGYDVQLLLGSQPAQTRSKAEARAAAESPLLSVGTHALFQDSVSYNNLGLVIVDEQHRFGVAQRADIQAKGDAPHMLLTTATPIPRSLAMTTYGDLDVSVIDEMPPGRQPVDTHWVDETLRAEIDRFIQQVVDYGEQVFVVYPRIENEGDLPSVEGGVRHLRRALDANVAFVHGEIGAEERDRVMQAFSRGEVDVLAATTVVEVGVDIPGATLIVIEKANRFGLSQLHQLRGRVGRNDRKSYCFLVTEREVSDNAQLRMDAMVQTTDGFEISRRDLEIRGAGNLLGSQQSGFDVFRMANLARDEELVALAREAAFAHEGPLPGGLQARMDALRDEAEYVHVG